MRLVDVMHSKSTRQFPPLRCHPLVLPSRPLLHITSHHTSSNSPRSALVSALDLYASPALHSTVPLRVIFVRKLAAFNSFHRELPGVALGLGQLGAVPLGPGSGYRVRSPSSSESFVAFMTRGIIPPVCYTLVIVFHQYRFLRLGV